MFNYELLQYLREREGYTRKQIEDFEGVKIATIAGYEKGRLRITEKYKQIVSAYFGISPLIFDLEDISDRDINEHRLSKLATALRRYMLWSGLTINDTYSLISKYGVKDTLFNIAYELDVKFAIMSLKLDDKVVNDLIDGRLSIEDLGNKYNNSSIDCFDVALSFILAVNKFKPSCFIDDFETFLSRVDEHTPYNIKLIEGDSEKIRAKLLALEKNGLELTKENVKKSFAQGVIINDEVVRKMLNLIQSNDTLKSKEALELIELLSRHPSALNSCLDKLRKLDEVLDDF